MTDPKHTAAVERVWARILAGDPRAMLESQLSPTDLQTLLLAATRRRATAVTPARLMRRWHEDRYVQPAASDPRAVSRLEARIWDLLPQTFAAIDLSPVTPLGTCSALALVDQHRFISTIRGSEVVSDPTNVLALEAARRRADTREDPVHLASCHRVIRGQPFHGQGLFQHFRLFALVSSGRDHGSRSTEAAMLTSHLAVWGNILSQLLPTHEINVEFTTFDSAPLAERIQDTVLPSLQPLPPRVTVDEDPQRERARSYYRGAAIRIDIGDGDAGLEVGDGGFTDWTAQLLGDAKERCLISCVATERLATLAVARAP
jgi:hypothetical protein